MSMTPDAKKALPKVIRGLRERLLDDLHAAMESAYRLGIPTKEAALDEAAHAKRGRLEEWIGDQVRALPAKERKTATERFRREIEKDAASTLLNRIVFLRLLEANDLRKERVVTGGWESRGYKDFREFAPELVRGDESEGYARLLQMIFGDLAIELPGLFGDVRLTALVPVPAVTLRAVVEELDAPELESCWIDDMTLGWVCQYWNDPEREALDAKLNDGGKVEPHEIASKTQMFTERYMVDWLLQNSLGPMWLAMCEKHGWTAEVEADGTLARLEERRAAWRAKRDAAEVELTDLMPLQSDAERRWGYYVPQPTPEDAVAHASDSVRDLKILDPAVGSGHFLVVAFDLLAALYREEARHRGEEGEPQWSEQAIVERILEHNLHGIDLDPRAVQIAAAALWLKAQQTCAEARPRQLNLVASNLRLSSLPASDPARRELREEVERETGIPGELTQRLVDALAGADHLGSLLTIDAAIDETVREMAGMLGTRAPVQRKLFGSPPAEQQRLTMSADAAKTALLAHLEKFLTEHTSSEDLGLRLRGEQLATGVRFVRLVQEGAYDLVVANPPYQGTSKMADAKYIEKHYPLGKADLFAAFLLRGLALARNGGVSAMLTMRSWMFLKQYAGLRKQVLERFDVRSLGDLDKGAFESMTTSQLISVCLCVTRVAPPSGSLTVALQPTAPGEKYWSRDRTDLKRAAVLSQRNRYAFSCADLRLIPEWPIIYWWDSDFRDVYRKYPLLRDAAPTATAQSTGDNVRFRRRVWELPPTHLEEPPARRKWHPYVGGADGAKWLEPLRMLLLWDANGLEIKLRKSRQQRRDAFLLASESHFNRVGISFPKIGDNFNARSFRVPSIFGDAAPTVFPADIPSTVCLLNSSYAQTVLRALNPSVNFGIEDVERLPLKQVDGSAGVFATVEASFGKHESHRETSIEFASPGPSPWRHTQEWAQLAIDRLEGEPLPAYDEELDPEPPTDHLSFALGITLGRFGADGEGILVPAQSDLSETLPSGICFLDGTLEDGASGDSLGHSASAPLHAGWSAHGQAVDPGNDLRTWLRLKFFGDVHRGMYENRPIYLPLASEKKTFAAFVSVHRWTESTLRTLWAEHLKPTLTRLEGEIEDLRAARQSLDKKTARDAEARYAKVVRWKDELEDFTSLVKQCAEKGPPSPDDETPEREADARYAPDLNDGVMVNSAALWPLLAPQWKDPRKWWKEIASAKGKKDYDWAHLAARYFPARIDSKCQKDASLAVAHGCFWKYHSETAYKWELCLQDEIAADFTIDEEDSDTFRTAFEEKHPDKVRELVAAEEKRRQRKRKKEREERESEMADDAGDEEAAAPGPLFEGTG